MHTSRALLVFDWNRLHESLYQRIVSESRKYDELVFVVGGADEGIGRGEILRCGELMVSLRSIFQGLDRPFFLFPITRRGASLLHYLLRWKILCPGFEQVYTDDAVLGEAAGRVLEMPVELWPPGEGSRIGERSMIGEEPAEFVRRGLLITRAQPFHLGHAAILSQMKREVDEVMVVIAMANRSHLPTDFATAGERMEMTGPWLQEHLPGSHFLVPLPYSDFMMENIYELRWLLPSFETIYSTNPAILAMAASDGYKVRGLDGRVDISGTKIRAAICQGEDFESMVTPHVYRLMTERGLAERLKILHKKEDR